MELFDTHCHIDFPVFDADRVAVLARARQAGVTRMVVPAVDAAGWDRLLGLCRREEGLHPALGLHPLFCDAHRAGHLTLLRTYVERQRPLAIGEIGLDFFHPQAQRERQIALFEAQLAIAEAFELPVLLHVRKAHDQVLQALGKFRLVGGIAHAFNGSLQQAERYLQHGFCFGFGGMLTYARSTRLRKLAASLPLEAIVLETDAPDMAPAAHHGERNSPEYLPEVVATLAELRDIPAAQLAQLTSANACKCFNL